MMFESYLFLYMCMRLLSYIPTILLISSIVCALGSIMHSSSSRTRQIIFLTLLGFTWSSHVLASQFHRLPPFSHLLPQISFSFSMIIWLLYFLFFFLTSFALQRIKAKFFSIGIWLFLTILFHQIAALLEKSLF